MSYLLISFGHSCLWGLVFALTFRFAWRRIPACWLFDTDDRSPHPLAHGFDGRFHGFLLFLLFTALSLALMEKAAQIGGFGALNGISSVRSLILFWLLAQTAFCDFYYRLLPDLWLMAIALLGIGPWLRCLLQGQGLLLSLLAAPAFCSLLSLLFYFLPRRFRGSPLMGFGDVKLLFALSLALPPVLFSRAFILAALLGGLWGAVLLLLHRSERGVPFGTVLAIAVVPAFL